MLFGTGLGIAWFAYMANRAGDVGALAAVLRHVVLADVLFTATAVVAQPVTGALLALEAGYAFTEGWLVAAIALYIVAGAC